MRTTIFNYILVITAFIITMPVGYAVPTQVEKLLLEQGYQAVPIIFVRDSDQFTVNLIFNNKPPQRFLIDNGTIETLIFPGLEKQFLFQKKSKSIPMHGGGGRLIP